MDPLLDINKVYGMVIKVEKQKNLSQKQPEFLEDSAIMTKDHNQVRTDPKIDGKKQDNSSLYCDYCRSKGHTRDNSFKIHGYPEWYRKMGEGKGKNNTRHIANMVDASPDGTKEDSTLSMKLKELIKQEVAELVRGKENMNTTNMVFYDDFAGTSTNSNSMNILNNNSWIIDSAASNHMCCNRQLMHNIKPVNNFLLFSLMEVLSKFLILAMCICQILLF